MACREELERRKPTDRLRAQIRALGTTDFPEFLKSFRGTVQWLVGYLFPRVILPYAEIALEVVTRPASIEPSA